MTTLEEESSDMPCPQSESGQAENVIVVSDRSTELKLMDNVASTCVAAFAQRRRFRRIVAYFYVPNSVYAVRFVLEISEMKCTDPRLAVYYRYDDGGMNMECVVTTARDAGAVQECEFICTNVCPTESIVKIYIQTQTDTREQNDYSSICGIKLPN